MPNLVEIYPLVDFGKMTRVKYNKNYFYLFIYTFSFDKLTGQTGG